VHAEELAENDQPGQKFTFPKDKWFQNLTTTRRYVFPLQDGSRQDSNAPVLLAGWVCHNVRELGLLLAGWFRCHNVRKL
jgi:hypothetical protein